jgi:hypothetical protein
MVAGNISMSPSSPPALATTASFESVHHGDSHPLMLLQATPLFPLGSHFVKTVHEKKNSHDYSRDLYTDDQESQNQGSKTIF